MIILLSCALVLMSILFGAATYYCLKFANKLLVMADSLETTLDVLDDTYGRISVVLAIPLFTDNDEVKKVIADIDRCRVAVLETARILTTIDESADGVDSDEEI